MSSAGILVRIEHQLAASLMLDTMTCMQIFFVAQRLIPAGNKYK